MMAPHCPILSTKLKRLVAEQVSFTLSAASLFSLPANPAMRIAKRLWCYKHSHSENGWHEKGEPPC